MNVYVFWMRVNECISHQLSGTTKTCRRVALANTESVNSFTVIIASL